MTKQKFEYPRHVDAVIYGPCVRFSSDQFLDLAIAALDQWVKPNDQEALSIFRRVEALRDVPELVL